MAKTILGVDIGYDNLKLVLMSGTAVKGAATIPMPRNMIRDGHVVSIESMGDMIRTAVKENSLRARQAAFALSNEAVYVKSVAMPAMTADQLLYNLPFEFRDYITGELREYIFDYGLYEKDPAAENENKLEMLAVACPKSVIDEARQIIRKSGMKLSGAGPALSSYMQLIRLLEKKRQGGPGEYCILDLGYQSIRMYIFHGERHVVTRILDIGMSSLDQVLADAMNVDIHLAHTYLMTNYENCTEREECLAAYDTIATELMRALNFFRFSNPESTLDDIWLCGGGAKIVPLISAIDDMLDMQVHPASELLPDGAKMTDPESYVQAIGITLE